MQFCVPLVYFPHRLGVSHVGVFVGGYIGGSVSNMDGDYRQKNRQHLMKARCTDMWISGTLRITRQRNGRFIFQSRRQFCSLQLPFCTLLWIHWRYLGLILWILWGMITHELRTQRIVMGRYYQSSKYLWCASVHLLQPYLFVMQSGSPCSTHRVSAL